MGAKLVVIGRPCEDEGKSFAEIIDIFCNEYGCVYRPCVTVAGIGPGSIEAMTGEVWQAITDADCLIGAERMLEAAGITGKPAFEAVSAEEIAQFIKNHREYQRFTVVMSGDTGFFSGTKKLIPLLSDCEVRVMPGLSSLSYLCAKLKRDYEDIKVASIHGREYNIVSDIRANSRVFVLTGGRDGVNNLCKTLEGAGLSDVKITVGENLGYHEEKITTGTAKELAGGSYSSLSSVLIENNFPDAVVTHGLPDDAFERSMGENLVPMTKSEVRSVCISKLKLTKRAICWDVGAGTGSVAVEMALQAKKGSVYAVEKKENAADLLRKNIEKFAVQNVSIICGSAPEVCENLPIPTHVFIGGSSGNMKEIISLVLEKNPYARIVATAISLETVGELTQCIKEFSFLQTEIISLSIAKGKKTSQYHLMNGQNPVYIFTMQNGGERL